MRARSIGAPRSRASQAGMTLLEIMIVLAIIGSLMGFLIGPKIIKAWEESRIKNTRILVNLYETAVLRWRLDHPEADCPATLEELHASSLENARPVDEWGQPLSYLCPGRDGAPWEVWSKGPDRRDGTPDDIRRAR